MGLLDFLVGGLAIMMVAGYEWAGQLLTLLSITGALFIWTKAVSEAVRAETDKDFRARYIGSPFPPISIFWGLMFVMLCLLSMHWLAAVSSFLLLMGAIGRKGKQAEMIRRTREEQQEEPERPTMH